MIEAETEIGLGDLLDVTSAAGWLPPVFPGAGFASLGGAVATDAHAKNHHCAGSIGAHIRTITLRQGPATVTQHRGTDGFAATLRGLGQTGQILSATLELTPLEGALSMRVIERRIPHWDGFVCALSGSNALYAVGWIDATATGSALLRGILEEAEPGPRTPPPRGKVRTVPMMAPRATLARRRCSGLQRGLHSARACGGGRTAARRLEGFFLPLDKIHGWNKLYGKAGFHQFQCVVPLNAATALRYMLVRIATAGLATPLAVLKRLGPAGAGLMSFPMEGLTLAVVLPNSEDARSLIRGLEEATARAGGRIYRAKDALASAETIHAMYPKRAAWAAAAQEADPAYALATDLGAALI